MVESFITIWMIAAVLADGALAGDTTLDRSAAARALPTPASFASPTPPKTSLEQLCVDEINRHRASIGLPPYARWTAAEGCADTQARLASEASRAHSSFKRCGELAQNVCPGWRGTPSSMIAGCLQMMWNEGPGTDFSRHGHYTNMSSTAYTKVACGFFTEPDGSVWAVQDFFD